MHLKSTMYESTRAPPKKESQPRLAALGSPFQGKGLAWTLPPSYGRRCPEGAEVGWREAVFQYHSLPRMGKVASGASRIGYWRDERERERSSQVRRLREHPIHRFSRHNAFPNGEGKEEAASSPKKKANPASLRSAAPSKGRGSRGHSLLPMEGGAPKGRRLDGGKRYEREGRLSQMRRLREYPIHRCAVPLPQWGRL